MRRVIAVRAKVIGGDIAWVQCGCAAVKRVARQILGTSMQLRMRAFLRSVVKRGAGICGNQRNIEIKVPRAEFPNRAIDITFLESTGVEDSKDLPGHVVWDVGDKLKCVIEGANDEAVVAVKGVGQLGDDEQPENEQLTT